MKNRLIIALAVLVMLLSIFTVLADGFTPEGWSEKDVMEFNKRYGSDIGRFFGVTDTADFTAQQVIDYFNSRPGIIADGYAVDENGIIVEASSIVKPEPEPVEPEPEDVKESFRFQESKGEDTAAEKPFPVVLAAALAAVLAAALATVIVLSKKKSK